MTSNFLGPEEKVRAFRDSRERPQSVKKSKGESDHF